MEISIFPDVKLNPKILSIVSNSDFIDSKFALITTRLPEKESEREKVVYTHVGLQDK